MRRIAPAGGRGEHPPLGLLATRAELREVARADRGDDGEMWGADSRRGGEVLRRR